MHFSDGNLKSNHSECHHHLFIVWQNWTENTSYCVHDVNVEAQNFFNLSFSSNVILTQMLVN